MDTIGPMERGEKYERPLDRDLEAQGLGMVMAKRWGLKKKLRSYNGELADEVHEFLNATQGEYRLKKILLRDGRVIEVCFQW